MPGRSLTLMPGRFAICRMPADAGPPSWPMPPGFISVTRTPDELSVVCDERDAPAGARVEAGWVLLKVDGPLEFSAVGIVASLASPIAEAGISIFVVSTFDTDYLLVKKGDLATAAAALDGAGHRVNLDGVAA